MTRDEYESSLYLAHHGVKGLKWGIRKYQNEDGSLTAEGKERYAAIESDTSVTRTVKNDLGNLSSQEFKRKYGVSSETYMKRVDKYGDPYAHTAKKYLVTAEKGINKEAAKVKKKNSKIQKDIDSFNGHENGIYHKNGKMLLSKDDVSQSLSSLKAQQAKNRKKLESMVSSISNNVDIVI